MIFKPKLVFLEENKRKICIDAFVKYENYVCALRFSFGGVEQKCGGKAERAFERGMKKALKSFGREQGKEFDFLPLAVECSLVCLDRESFERQLGKEKLLFLENETERAMKEYFRENREVGSFVLDKR